MTKKYIIELMFWFSLAGIILLNSFFQSNTFYTVVQRVLVPGLIGYWVINDASERGWEKGKINNYAFFSFFLPPITIPIYLVKTRGWKGLGKFIWNFSLYLFAFMFTISLAMGITTDFASNKN